MWYQNNSLAIYFLSSSWIISNQNQFSFNCLSISYFSLSPFYSTTRRDLKEEEGMPKSCLNDVLVFNRLHIVTASRRYVNPPSARAAAYKDPSWTFLSFDYTYAVRVFESFVSVQTNIYHTIIVINPEMNTISPQKQRHPIRLSCAAPAGISIQLCCLFQGSFSNNNLWEKETLTSDFFSTKKF